MANGGKRPGAGRPRGKLNTFTRTAREAFQIAFDTLGGPAGLAKWAKENQTEFYRIYGRLIPVEIENTGEVTLKVRYVDTPKQDETENEEWVDIPRPHEN